MATKRAADDLTRISDVNKRSCSGDGDTTESLMSGESDHHVWFGMREEVKRFVLSSIVSLTVLSSDRGELFPSSGIAIECQNDFTKFLTSASLVRAFKDATAKKGVGRTRDTVKIEVRCQERVLIGRLEEYDLDHEIAVVSIRSALPVCSVDLYLPVKYALNNDVVTVGHKVNGRLLILTGKITVCSWASQNEDSEYLMFSTCKLTEDFHGGPLFDSVGRFVGMNLLSDVGGSIFLPRSIILEQLEHLRSYPQRRVFVQLMKAVRNKVPATGDKFNCHTEGHKDVLNKIRIGNYKTNMRDFASLGYPRPSLHNIDPGMILINTFEERFGDEYPGGVWREFRERVSSNILRNVVALASFHGETRFFCIYGIFYRL